MIPSPQQCYQLWDKYRLSQKKRIHCELVSQVAFLLGTKLKEKGIPIDLDLLIAASLLHDIDKNAQKRDGEPHPESAVRILKEEGMEEVSSVVARHSLHLILNPETAPATWEHKLLYLSDKMARQEVVGVDRRFAAWRAEKLPDYARQELNESYPKVKALEKEIYTLAETTLEEIKKMI